MFFETEGIVLKRSKMLESDMMIVVYTKDYGLTKLVASGARNKGAGISMSTQLFSVGRLLYSQSSKYNRIKSFEPTALGFRISESLKSVSFASYFAELVIKTIPEGAGGSDVFELIKSCFERLVEGNNNYELIRCIFELKLLRLLGYEIMLGECARCSSVEGLNYFSVMEGGIICENCHSFAKEGYKIGLALPKLIEFIMVSEFEEILKVEIAYEYLKKLQTISGEYYKNHLNIVGLKTLEMVGIF